jgi:flagellar protein FlaG
MRIDALTTVNASQADGVGAGTRKPSIAVPEAPQQRANAGEESTVASAAKQIESFLKSMGRTLEFRVDAETNRTVVTVRDSESGEVIRQIPGDEVLQLARRLAAGGGGLVNLKV